MRTTGLFFLCAAALALACGPGAHEPSADEVAGVARAAEVAECLELEDAALVQLPELEVGCSARRAFRVMNGCAFPVNVTGISLEPVGSSNADDVVLVQAPAIPSPGLEVEAGDSLVLALRQRPRGAGAHAARLSLNVEGGEASWTFTGSARPLQRIVDRYLLPEPSRMDLLIVIDNGPLLASYLESVRVNLASFAYYASFASLFRHIGIATTGGSGGAGRAELIGGVLDPSAPGFIDEQVEGILAGLEIRPGLEDPLQVALEVAQKAQPGGPYASLFQELRDTAVVIVTAGSDASPYPARYYYEWLHRLAGGGRGAPWRLSVSVVGAFPGWRGPPWTGTTSCGAVPDDGMLHWVAWWTGGIHDSICTPDWSKSLEGLGVVHLGLRTRVQLSEDPDLARAPLEVRFEGLLLPEFGTRGEQIWSYDSVSNTVSLEPWYGPEPEQTVEVSYAPACTEVG